ncbi:MAG: hypothetical protein QM594_11725 [Niabella sp.]
MPFIAFSNGYWGLKYEMQQVTNGKIYVIVQVNKNYTFDSARYTVFIPDGVNQLQAVFIHQHGCEMEGRGASSAYDLQYQAFSKKWEMAIVGTDLYSSKGNCHDWRDPGSGSGQALIKTLQEVGKISGHPEQADLPWLLWGHSGGGYWALSMLRQYPERILAVVGYSPAFEPGTYPDAALKVPVILRHAGPEGDAPYWQTSVKEFGKLRSAGGYASIAYTPYQNHNFSYIRYMAIPFYEAVMQQRLPLKPGSGYINMRMMDSSKVWLGDTLNYNIYQQNYYPGDKMNAAWFPDSITAARWREYVITGTVIDRSPPPVPYDVQTKRRHSATVALTWKAVADIESGIDHFNIYKDDQIISRFPSSGSYQQFDTNGDDAYPLLPLPLQTDITLLQNDPGKISVTAVNHFGLESPKAISYER